MSLNSSESDIDADPSMIPSRCINKWLLGPREDKLFRIMWIAASCHFAVLDYLSAVVEMWTHVSRSTRFDRHYEYPQFPLVGLSDIYQFLKTLESLD